MLAEAGYAHAVADRLLDDGGLACGAVAPGAWVMALAYLKASWAARWLAAGSAGESAEDSVVLGADTVCADEGRVIGQPRDGAEARAMLRSFVGRAHGVLTGVAIVGPGGGERELFFDSAVVTWGDVGEAEIEAYVDSGAWRGKAGGYNLRERLEAGWPIACEGDPGTVMGLPMRMLGERLVAWGVEPSFGPEVAA